MPSHQGIGISYAAEGPWITFYGKDSHVSYNLRWLVRRQILTGGNTLQKRTLREWLNTREAEGKKVSVAPRPDEPRVKKRGRS